MEDLPNCWELKKCGRDRENAQTSDLGECVASKEGMGHSCWAVAGTLCGGEVQGTYAQKESGCLKCEVYNLYHRGIGSQGQRVQDELPVEDAAYRRLMMARFNNL